MENKPKVLYRGLKVNYNNLANFDFSADLKVNYEPIIDEYGRKTVIDGNEYGVYMSDNLSMVISAYGEIHNDGIPVYNNLSINYKQILIPSVAVIYQINTNNLNIRKPFISKQLQGHYNNGYQGDEWIADLVPASNYTLYRVRIGKDILHDAEDIDLTKTDNISKKVKEKLEMRKYRLETFASAMEQIPLIKRNTFGREEINILKSIYGKNGLKYISENSLITDNVDGMINYLISKTFKQNESNIDFRTIKYLNNLKTKATDVDSIIEILRNDKIKNMQEKISFEEKKKKEKTPYVTTKFDVWEKKLDSLISMIIIRRKKDLSFSEIQQDIPIHANLTKEDQEWEMAKEKYDYNELEFERKQELEEGFHQMTYKRLMKEFGFDEKLFEELFDEELDDIEVENVDKEKRIM